MDLLYFSPDVLCFARSLPTIYVRYEKITYLSLALALRASLQDATELAKVGGGSLCLSIGLVFLGLDHVHHFFPHFFLSP